MPDLYKAVITIIQRCLNAPLLAHFPETWASCKIILNLDAHTWPSPRLRSVCTRYIFLILYPINSYQLISFPASPMGRPMPPLSGNSSIAPKCQITKYVTYLPVVISFEHLLSRSSRYRSVFETSPTSLLRPGRDAIAFRVPSIETKVCRL
jgi:hypothetical protein